MSRLGVLLKVICDLVLCSSCVILVASSWGEKVRNRTGQ